MAFFCVNWACVWWRRQQLSKNVWCLKNVDCTSTEFRKKFVCRTNVIKAELFTFKLISICHMQIIIAFIRVTKFRYETFKVLKRGNEKSSSIDCARKVRCYMSHKRVFGRCTLMMFISFQKHVEWRLSEKEIRILVKLKTILEIVWELIRVIAKCQFEVDFIASFRIVACIW